MKRAFKIICNIALGLTFAAAVWVGYIMIQMVAFCEPGGCNFGTF
jgi:hypothetical protein